MNAHSLLLTLAVICGLASQAQADLLSIWVTGKQQHLLGIEKTYGTDSLRPVEGLEAGVELFGVDLWAEGTKLGEGHYLLTANIGADATFGDAYRLNIGLFTGPIATMAPEASGTDFALPQQVRSALTSAGADASEVERSLSEQFAEEERQVGRYGIGWNIGRVRLQLESEVLPFVYLGVGGQAGYHYFVRGKDIADEAKERMVTQIESGYGLGAMGDGLGQQLRDATGAKPFEPAAHFGVNYDLGAYLKIEL